MQDAWPVVVRESIILEYNTTCNAPDLCFHTSKNHTSRRFISMLFHPGSSMPVKMQHAGESIRPNVWLTTVWFGRNHSTTQYKQVHINIILWTMSIARPLIFFSNAGAFDLHGSVYENPDKYKWYRMSVIGASGEKLGRHPVARYLVNDTAHTAKLRSWFVSQPYEESARAMYEAKFLQKRTCNTVCTTSFKFFSCTESRRCFMKAVKIEAWADSRRRVSCEQRRADLDIEDSE